MRKSIHLRTAESAWAQLAGFVEHHGGKTGTDAAKFKGRCLEFAGCLRQNGLALAVTFFRGKGNKEMHADYVQALVHTLYDVGRLVKPDTEALVRQALQSSAIDYRKLTEATALAALWYKRLAEALIEAGD